MMTKIKFGILLIIVTIVVLLPTMYSKFLFNKLFMIPTQLKLTEDAHSWIILYPIANNNTTVQLFLGREVQLSYIGTIVLTPEQVINYNKLGTIHESFHDFDGWGQGSLTVNSNDNNSKIIKIYLKRRTRFHFNYRGEYKLIDNNIILTDATFDIYAFERHAFFILLVFFSFLAGIVFIIIGIIQKIWPPKKKYSFLESPFDSEDYNSQSGQPK